MTRLPIRYQSAWAWLLTLLGSPARFADLRFDDKNVRVRMGYMFRTRFPRADIVEVAPFRTCISIGVHGWKGRWLVNGAHRPIARISLRAPASARVLGFPVQFRELMVSVDDVALLDRLLLG